jgi:alpha-galactosidase
MDESGRPVPGAGRFPYSADRTGLQGLASYVHSKGLKRGIYAMRGIPTGAIKDSVTIKGTTVMGAQLANPNDICSWAS